jgi:uncharacterized protein involved in exopolysaccharide biosynthesis
LEPRAYLRLLRRGWPLVLALTAVGALAGIAVTLTTPKAYQADVQLFVAT